MALFGKEKKTQFVNPEEDATRALEVALAGALPDESQHASTAEHTEEAPLEVIEEPVKERTGVRLLVIVEDVTLFEEGADIRSFIVALGAYFEEVHVIAVVSKEIPPLTLRLSQNIWVYPTRSSGYLGTLYAVYRIARTQLSFAGGFRPDYIYLYNAHRLSFVTFFLARFYKRPFGIYTTYNPFAEEGTYARGWGDLHWFLEHMAFIRTGLIHAPSRTIGASLRNTFGSHVPIEILPSFYTFLNEIPDATRGDVETPFEFTILGVFAGVPERNPAFLINICAPIMERYGSVGLVIVGEPGSVARARIAEERIAERVRILPFSELHTAVAHAHLLINIGTHEAYEPIIVVSAVYGLPILTAAFEGGELKLKDGVHALLCRAYDASCFLPTIERFLSNNALRTLLARNARVLVQEQYEGSFKRHVETVYAGVCDSLVRYHERDS